ncbi:Uu.00g059800.m01.CDS01 [Anthostomella pinea]|uniref:Uu.00g059800.m01.CDS01 n=1 Tax=Anthostomella pinea TaxID=933095 RepID=A0AAI8VS57_9PEZI|nr:Uu.00g059800.m01.CDS01 [Anthostomella pinea]
MHVVVRHMARQFPNGIFYLNLWPFSATLMVVANPLAAAQVEAAFLDKPGAMCSTLEIINGGPSLMTMHGATWKKWRGLFNPGFSAGYMIGLAPAIADEVAVFCKLLQGQARERKVFQLEEFILRLTFDVISRITLDARLSYQTQGSALADCLRRQVYWTQFGTTFNPIRRYLSPRPLVQKYNSYRMNRYLDGEIDKRFEELALSRRSPRKEFRAPNRSIISLAMDQYLGEVGNDAEPSKEAFRELVKPQLRMFLYAGHDTTSSTLLYCFHLLSQHPEAMAKVRAEHDTRCWVPIPQSSIALSRRSCAFSLLREACGKGVPTSSSRTREGHQYPTEGCHIWSLSLVMHNPAVFVRPEEFLPERWIVGPRDPLHPNKGAWRAFEWGPRSCIGQTLAQLELKVALVMTARLFDITLAYDEWDQLHPRKGIKSVDGNRVYPAEMGGGGAHPADGFPVRVTLRD